MSQTDNCEKGIHAYIICPLPADSDFKAIGCYNCGHTIDELDCANGDAPTPEDFLAGRAICASHMEEFDSTSAGYTCFVCGLLGDEAKIK